MDPPKPLLLQRTATSGGSAERHLVRLAKRREVRGGKLQLQRRFSGRHQGLTQKERPSTTLCIPIDVLARDLYACLFPVKGMQVTQVSEHDITDFGDARFRRC